jgi:hypothetical protein
MSLASGAARIRREATAIWFGAGGSDKNRK